MDLKDQIRAAQLVVPCHDLASLLSFFTDDLGFKINLIMPADAPKVAVISAHGVTLRLEEGADRKSLPELRLLCNALSPEVTRELSAPNGMKIQLVNATAKFDLPEGTQEFVISRHSESWGVGRAGMQYRDLIPSRLGGRFIASHIRIPEGGPVPDYVHFHKIRFQMIYCKTGWARLVYEDQGEPFLFHAGDCVLQPPEIRHRVLEASAGLEVIEIGCPAIHETCADHVLALPTGRLLPKRDFGGQRFVRHIAAEADWKPSRVPGFEYRDTGIEVATDGLAGARFLRTLARPSPAPAQMAHSGEFYFLFIMRGELELQSQALGHHKLTAEDSCVIPAGAPYALMPAAGTELLEVSLPAKLPLTPA